MLNIEKSSLILILIIVVLIAGFVSLVTLGYTPGSVWHKAEDIKPGEVGKSVGATATSTYLFPNLEAKSQVTAGTNFHVGATTITSGKVTGLDMPTNANDAATKGYVDELGGTGESMLMNGVHTYQDCAAIGGEVVNTEIYENKQCRVAGSSCPTGWSQNTDWNATETRHCHVGHQYPDNGCTAAGHAWGMRGGGERCYYEDIYDNPLYCYSVVTQIGCY